ncbi:MAG: hypothetical protein HY645_11270 [Acidobacteria bacterium]|nr:hypothetical protein [Acidobacteriota bacterium]
MKLSKDFFFRKRVVTRTTWKFRLLLLALFGLVFVLPYEFWLVRLANSLVQQDPLVGSDAILMENWNLPQLSIFYETASLQKSGYATRALIPEFVETRRTLLAGIRLPKDFDSLIRLYCREAGLDPKSIERIPVEAIDPITLNTARQLSVSLKARRVRSIIMVSSFYRSKRSALAFKKFLEPEGIKVICHPVNEVFSVGTWWKTKDGWIMVPLEFVKLNYYRLLWL